MTKKLEDLLNLDDSKEIIKQAQQQEKEQTKHEIAHEESFRDIAEFDKIASALPAVKGLGDKADSELEDIAQRALTAYEDLMDLGMNVESRYSGRVFEVAGGLLKTSLDAKTAKLETTIETTAAAIGAATARSIFEVDGFFIVHQSSQNQVVQELFFED